MVDSHSNDGKTEVKTATLSNDDISRIINGRPDDPIEKKPFLLCATLRKIFNSWMKVSFVPIIYNALMHKKVLHTLDEGGASIDMTVKLNNVQDSYQR